MKNANVCDSCESLEQRRRAVEKLMHLLPNKRDRQEVDNALMIGIALRVRSDSNMR